MSVFTKSRTGWLAAKGLIYSVEWIDANREDYGHYNVVFSYSANSGLHTGSFTDYGKEEESYLHRGDLIDILYDPRHPDRNFYPFVRSATNRRLIAISIGAVAALIMMTWALLTGVWR